jgi:Acetyltransferase (GNAT) family
MLGVRGTRGWIGGMGVVAAARGRGLGRAAMDAVLGEARRAGITQVALEVLEANAYAGRIYEALGFLDTRALDVWKRPASDDVGTMPAAGAGTGAGGMSGPGAERVDPAHVLAEYPHLHATTAPWQRERRTLDRVAPPDAWGVRHGGRLVLSALTRVVPTGLTILDLGADASADAAARAAFLAALLARHPGQEVTLVNLPRDDAFSALMPAAGFARALVQREMRL